MKPVMISQLRKMAVRGLERMYCPAERLFVFRVRRKDHGIVSEGLSRRYTAITLIGLAEENEEIIGSVLSGHGLTTVCERLSEDIDNVNNLGDVALSLWATIIVGDENQNKIFERLVKLRPEEKSWPTVEISWALASLCNDCELPVGDLRKKISDRLISSLNEKPGVFPHILGENGSGLRAHVSCFADMVYPIHALAKYFKVSGDQRALKASERCAQQICRLQGPEGQWWWHYDLRTGKVIEPFPVYSVHQDSMAPMALFELRDAGGVDYSKEIQKGLEWLAHSPEIGSSLIDRKADLIWRKVARREPRKLSRYIQAAASRLHQNCRFPLTNSLFPPISIDYENRPYHLGWILYAWPEARAAEWDNEYLTQSPQGAQRKANEP